MKNILLSIFFIVSVISYGQSVTKITYEGYHRKMKAIKKTSIIYFNDNQSQFEFFQENQSFKDLELEGFGKIDYFLQVVLYKV